MEVLDLPAALGLLAKPAKSSERDAKPEAQRTAYGAPELLGMPAQIGTNGVDCFLGSGHDRWSLVFQPARVNGQFAQRG